MRGLEYLDGMSAGVIEIENRGRTRGIEKKGICTGQKFSSAPKYERNCQRDRTSQQL